MSLVIEDGSIVAGANSYISAADCRAYADARGISLDASDAVVEMQLVVATDYLEGIFAEYQGILVSPGIQALQWPRSGVLLFGNSFPQDQIPTQLKNAQCAFVCNSALIALTEPDRDAPFVVEETIGPITTKYSEALNAANYELGGGPMWGSVRTALAPILISALSTSGGFALTSLRL